MKSRSGFCGKDAGFWGFKFHDEALELMCLRRNLTIVDLAQQARVSNSCMVKFLKTGVENKAAKRLREIGLVK